MRVVMMATLSSLVAPEVVIMTTSGATSDDKVAIMKTLRFHCLFLQLNIFFISMVTSHHFHSHGDILLFVLSKSYQDDIIDNNLILSYLHFRYTTKHLNDTTTPKAVKALLA